MLGEMEGTNGRGRPCGEWLDDIKEWCEKDIGYLREGWGKTEIRGRKW